MPNRKLQEWVGAVQELCDSIRGWCEARGWFVHQEEKTLTEEKLGTYTVPTLLIQSPGGRIHVDPVARNIIGANGRVDIESFPSLNRLLLVRVGNRWKLKTDSGITWPEPWSEETFVRIVGALTAAA